MKLEAFAHEIIIPATTAIQALLRLVSYCRIQACYAEQAKKNNYCHEGFHVLEAS